MGNELESFGNLREVDREAGRVTAVISTGDIARDQAIIDPSGWDFSNYDRNPVILWMHDAGMMPFARTIERVATEKELVAKAQFDLDDPFAQTVLRKIEAGYVNATSVRWLPKRTDFRKTGKGKDAGQILVFVEQELLEWSFVTIPADPKALIMRADGSALEIEDYIDDRAAIASHSTATDTDSPWNGPQAVAGAPNDAKILRYMHAWVNSEGDPDAKGSYKFPHHAPRKGAAANIAGVNNALARLPQAQIPAGDREGVEAHLRRHRRDAGLEDYSAEQMASLVRGNGHKTALAEANRAEEIIAGFLERRMRRPTPDDLFVRSLSKATGKTPERIRQEMAEGRY